jgi:hypothetical protein
MSAIEAITKRRDARETWSVVVVYENTATSERAMAVCDHLVQQFWSEVEFNFHWWRTDFLEDPGMAATAASNAASADFVIFCAGTESELSPLVSEWCERWVGRRGGREGAFVDLTEATGTPASRAPHTQTYLRQIARRAMMDYLTQVPTTIMGTLPNSFESAAMRATHISSVLDDILHHSPPPSHYGLNE